MTHTPVKLMGLAIAVGAFALLVLAATPNRPRHEGPGRVEEHFTELDKDGNGALSRDELASHHPGPRGPGADEHFARLDRNGDGQIQREELELAHKDREAHHQEMFKRADQDGDGKISRAEFLAMQPEQGREHRPWERLDQNGDGLIQRSELPAPPADGQMPPPPPLPPRPEDRMGPAFDAAPPPPPPADRPDAPRPPFMPDPEQWFRDCDTNGDGALDQSELEAHHATMRAQAFDHMDDDHDGFLTPDEWRPPRGPGEPPGLEHGLRHEQGSQLGRAEGTAGASAGASTLPTHYVLHENYPNPFNSTTQIRYELPEASDVLLAVYNLSGELVKTLTQEHQPAGSYQVELRMDGQSSGVYLCRLQAGDFKAVTRMTYVK